jgi:electron transport complex protein RnfG
MVDVIRLTAVLTLISVLAAGAIALTNKYTESRIRMHKTALQMEALQAVFPAGISVRPTTGTAPLPPHFWIAEKQGKAVGYAFQDSSRGYANEIQFIIGVDTQGVISGIKIISQNETPGLGKRIEETSSALYLWSAPNRKREKSDPWFTRQFVGIDASKRIPLKNSKEWRLLSDAERRALMHDNAVTAITGASVTSRAIVQEIRQSIPGYVQFLSHATVAP